MVFVSKDKSKKDLVFDVASSVGLASAKMKKGEVGIEIEAEGVNLLHEDDTPFPWNYHEDGSLRGQENAEYVLQTPAKFTEVEKALDTLWAAFEKKKSKFDDSNRTSVHIHLNVQNFYLNRLTSLVAMYYVVEEMLTEWCGDHRVGNLFCLRAKDAPAIVSTFRKFVQKDMLHGMTEHVHYAGLNFHSIYKFGSLEFRAMRGTSDKTLILRWVRILERLYRLSEGIRDPRDVCYQFSGEGPLQYVEWLLGEEAELIQAELGWSEQRLRDSLYDGIRQAQDICYCRNWDLFQPIELQPDPFGRDKKRMVNKLKAAIQEDIPSIGNPTWEQEYASEDDYEDYLEPVSPDEVLNSAPPSPVQSVTVTNPWSTNPTTTFAAIWGEPNDDTD